MKTPLKFLLLIAATATFIWACSSSDDVHQLMEDDVSITNDDIDPSDDGSSGATAEFETVNIQIEMPDGINLDYTSLSLNSFGQSFSIDQNGISTAIIKDGGHSFVHLKDDQDRIVMMGFISKIRPTIDVTSTLEASLFFSLGTVFALPEIRKKVLDEFQNLPEVQTFAKELEALYKTDPYILQSGQFSTWLNEVGEKLTTKNTIDIDKAILVTDNTIKSGITIAQDDSDVFSLNALNFSRRRANAFIYKTHVKEEGQSSFTEIVNPRFLAANDTKADKNILISAVTGVTSIQGNTLDIVLGNGNNLGFTTNGPAKLNLLDNENAVKYQVRVVGPGGIKTNNNTADEAWAISKMNVETLLFDFVIPVVSTAIGSADIIDVKSDKFDVDTGLEIINTILASTPNAADALDDGDFVTATKELMKGIFSNGIGTEKFMDLFVPFLPDLLSGGAEDLAARMAAPLTVTNGILTGVDFGRIIYDIKNAKQLEIFELIVGESKVRITPPVKGISVQEEATFTAKVIDDNDVQPDEYRYEWRTTGNFGNFKTDSEVDNIVYRSSLEAATFSGNARDSIYVRVFKDGSLVGKDSSVINVYPEKYRIRPGGITLQGGDNLALRIVDTNNEELILDTEVANFRVIWNTAGNYGSFEGSKRNVSSSTSTKVVYQCFDKEVERATENVTAKIYYSLNGVESEDILIQELEGSINIENDENKLLYTVNSDVAHWINRPTAESPFYNYGVYAYWPFDPKRAKADLPEGKEVERYHLQIIEPFNCTISKTWYPENQENDLTSDGTYQLICGSSSGGGHEDTWDEGAVNEDLQRLIANAEANKGYGRVTVYLKNKQ